MYLKIEQTEQKYNLLNLIESEWEIHFSTTDSNISLILLKEKLIIASVKLSPFNDIKWIEFNQSPNKKNIPNYKIKLKCSFAENKKIRQGNSSEKNRQVKYLEDLEQDDYKNNILRNLNSTSNNGNYFNILTNTNTNINNRINIYNKKKNKKQRKKENKKNLCTKVAVTSNKICTNNKLFKNLYGTNYSNITSSNNNSEILNRLKNCNISKEKYYSNNNSNIPSLLNIKKIVSENNPNINTLANDNKKQDEITSSYFQKKNNSNNFNLNKLILSTNDLHANELEKNFDSIITNENIITQNDSNNLDFQEKAEDDFLLNSHYSNLLMESDKKSSSVSSYKKIDFNQIKNDFFICYNNSYFKGINTMDNIDDLKKEIKGVICKMNELHKAYYMKIKNKKAKFKQKKKIYFQNAQDYYNIYKKINNFNDIEIKYDFSVNNRKISLYSNVFDYSSYHLNEIKLIKNSFSLAHNESNNDSNSNLKNRKQNLIKIMKIIYDKNKHKNLLNKFQVYFLDKIITKILVNDKK